MAWWIPMAITAASSIYGAVSGSAQNRNQREWNQYNATMQYNTDMTNIMSQTAIAGFNSNMAMMRGKINARLAIQESKINSSIIYATTVYNDGLLAEEGQKIEEGLELDLELVRNERAQERGAIEAVQSASGVVMGEYSAADVITHQMAQEAMDALVLRHGADIQAAEIMNSRAKGLWEGGMQIKKTMYDGQTQALSSRMGGAMEALSISTQAGISALTQSWTAKTRYKAGYAGAEMQYNQNQNQITNNLVQGLFSAGVSGATSYYAMKTPVSGLQPTSTSVGTSYTFSSGHTGTYSLTRPASSGEYSLATAGASLI